MLVFCNVTPVWRKGEVCTRCWWGNQRVRDHWGDQDVDGRIILRWIFRKWERVVGAGEEQEKIKLDSQNASRSGKQRLTAVGTCYADHVTPLYPQKLARTSPTGGGRSVGIVRSRTKATEFSFFSQNAYEE
jgi:hypothetical protein